MNDHDMDARLRSWARSRAERTAPKELRRQILAIPTTESKTRRRPWIRLLPGPKPTAGADGRHDPAKVTASTTTNHIGGTRSMFSATKLVAAAASVALFGALLVAGPLTLPGEDSAPAAAPPTQPGNMTHFSGTLRFLGQDHMGAVTRHDWGTEALGEQWTTRVEANDPRYSGLGTAFDNAYVTQPGSNELRSYNGRLFTKDGSWHTVGRAYTDPETGGLIGHEYAVGEGDYEGLYALTTLLQKPGSSLVDLKGIIFEGGLPETPGDAPSEIPPIHLDP